MQSKTLQRQLSATGTNLFFASESVGEGHPDKLCDQVSDGILDACLKVNPNSRVAMETAVKTGMVSLACLDVTVKIKSNLNFLSLLTWFCVDCSFR